MYNFLRWYPTGISVFIAHTRPLVAQQLAACVKLTGMSPESVIEFTGEIPRLKRKQLWTSMRAIFLTPQVLVNDIEANVCPASSVRLIVFDEAHKATGNHSYCQVLRLLTSPPYSHRQFRVVALSATPATDIQGVQTVIANLLISHLELRLETSADVTQYTQHRQVDTVVIPLGPELNRFRTQILECLRKPLERLVDYGVIRSGWNGAIPEHIPRFAVIKARQEWIAQKSASNLPQTIGFDFDVVICLLYALETLIQHGLRPLYEYLTGVVRGERKGPARSILYRVPGFDLLLSDLANRFYSTPKSQTAIDSVNLEPVSTQTPFLEGHPKLDKLKELLCEHFRAPRNSESKVMIFSQLRDSVNDIMSMLKRLRPLVRPACFMGQSSGSHRSPRLNEKLHNSESRTNSPASFPSTGISQRDQLRIMNAFRTGIFNTLVSTCVGEEGFDVGQVDLIICFDASKSPIQLMQRLGRTGRQRFGRIVILVTEGQEEKNLATSMARTSSIRKALVGDGHVKLAFYPHNPRMVPLSIQPQVEFKDLKPRVILASPTERSPKTAHESRKRKPQKSHHDRIISGQDDAIRSHADAIGLDKLTLRLIPNTPDRVLCLGDSNLKHTLQSSNSYLTSLYDLTSSRRLQCARNCLQSLLVPGTGKGPSSSTRHLVSVLRLVELHRLGLTQLSYHALGLRSVDCETDMKELVGNAAIDPNKEVQSQPTVSLPGSDSKTANIAHSYPVSSNPSDDNFDPHCCSLEYPKLTRGVVSNEYFFSAKLDTISDTAKTALKIFSSYQAESDDPITEINLRTRWQECQNSSEILRTKASANEFSTDGLENWVEGSLLEAIEPNCKLRGSSVLDSTVTKTIDETLTLCGSSLRNAETTEFLSTVTPVGAKNGLAAAFHLASSSFLTGHCDARSTPLPPKRCALSGPFSAFHLASEVGIDEALALLDQSTTHLDASSILGDSQRPSCTVRSALFIGNACPPAQDSSPLEFGIKLRLGADFDDLLQPSQADACESAVPKTSSPCNSQTGSDIFNFSSQISWSPVPVKDENDSPLQNIPNDSAFSNAADRPAAKKPDSISKMSHETSKESVVSPLVPSRQRAKNRERANYLLQTQPETDDAIHQEFIRPAHLSKQKGVENGRDFLLTQAAASDTDTESDESCTNDAYERSFIDDRSVIEMSKSGDKPDGSSMMSVYLQTIRSPQFGRPLRLAQGSNFPVSRFSHSHSSPPDNGFPGSKTANSVHSVNRKRDYIFSQIPEQDEDYELDSFCVDTVESVFDEDIDEFEGLQHPKKRHRRKCLQS
ncbi:unnamed protein product [Calicophoron daubneyi]|uniref:Fanconi anemia group M protein n=1 Tax=Calicophoron daubneyi TaxID=300641 RepID=A0AAV2TU70_CALDB